MKLVSNARVDSWNAKICSQADTIRYYQRELVTSETDNVMLSKRVAELEAVLQCAGVMNQDGSYKDNASTVLQTVSIVMEKLEAER